MRAATADSSIRSGDVLDEYESDPESLGTRLETTVKKSLMVGRSYSVTALPPEAGSGVLPSRGPTEDAGEGSLRDIMASEGPASSFVVRSTEKEMDWWEATFDGARSAMQSTHEK